MKQPDVVTWITILGACRSNGNIEIAERVADNALKLDPNNASIYVLLSNLYSDAKLWEKRKSIRNKMEQLNIKKIPGETCFELNGKIHVMRSGDVISKEAEHELQILLQDMKNVGYKPNTKWVTWDVKDNEKEELLCRHR